MTDLSFLKSVQKPWYQFSQGKDKKLTVQTLVDNYLAEEMFDGENQYQCDRCKRLRDAVKSTRILEGPEHLMCTLMRFKYDRAVCRKSKVFTDVDYELRIRLPVSQVNHLYSLIINILNIGIGEQNVHTYQVMLLMREYAL